MWQTHDNYLNNPLLRGVFENTNILRKPITGIVSNYHELPYILLTPDDENPSRTVEINGKVSVSPKFIISPNALGDTFGDVFDPETFDNRLEGRLFVYAHGRNKNLKVKSDYLRIESVEHKLQEYSEQIQDRLFREENVRTGLVLGPAFQYYPISVDRFISEIVDREFMV